MIYYTVYKTTNLVNDKIYVGAHKTENPYDRYLGSNLPLKRAIKKYGRKNFKKEIIKFCNSEEEMFECEANIVNENFIAREDTYNLIEGGKGWTGLGQRVLELGTGIHSLSFDERSKISKERIANTDPELLRERNSKAGKIGGRVCVERKRGIHGLSEEARMKNSKAGIAAAREKGCGFFNPKFQSELGKRGGPKNKGFKWYNNGEKSFKYTLKEQFKEDFYSFLKNNPQFSEGRIFKTTADTKWMNNGTINKRVPINEIDIYLSNGFIFGRI